MSMLSKRSSGKFVPQSGPRRAPPATSKASASKGWVVVRHPDDNGLRVVVGVPFLRHRPRERSPAAFLVIALDLARDHVALRLPVGESAVGLGFVPPALNLRENGPPNSPEGPLCTSRCPWPSRTR